jgi:hypothetical protein
MMCNVTYVMCRYSMLNGVIDSREVRRVKAADPSRSSGGANRQRSRQGAVEDARLQEVIAQHDAYYQNWFTSQQEQMSPLRCHTRFLCQNQVLIVCMT